MWKIRITLALAVAALVPAAVGSQSTLNQDAVTRIRTEGMTRSEAPALFAELVDGIGPRLTGSLEYKRAADWARGTLDAWGLDNARLEPFPFGRGWQLEYFAIEMIEPRYMPLTGHPEAWTPSTPGDVIATPVLTAGRTAADIGALAGRIKGGIVMPQPKVADSAFIRRDRAQPADQPDPPAPQAGAETTGGRQGAGRQGRTGGRGGGVVDLSGAQTAQTAAAALRDAAPAVTLLPSRGEHGTLFVQAGRPTSPQTSTRVVLIPEHYNMLARMIERGIAVKVRVNVNARALDDPNSYNVLAELPGSDPSLRDEVVMLGAHLDSWHAAPGATDNADGVAAAMEAFRILKATGLTPLRTLRLALWGGEEQGLLGSRAWVAQHLAGDANAAARDKLFVYFNIDPGKGPIYGWYLENKDALRPVFDAWLQPFMDLGAKRNVRQGIRNTDHLSFINVGVPGFNPVQDYTGYDVREHHTNADTFERIKDADLRQAAVILASFLYHAGHYQGTLR
ncbi:MAG: M20/M25/M40 family metallo-hydrolase [Vicinamibacterales bacterium]